jgi:NADH-quinone oxidoreductase subunit J
MEGLFFYAFSGFAVIGALALVAFKNPVSSAMSMVASFLGLAALFISLNAYFVGIIQILVYAGAIMVLFVFIILLLDLRPRSARPNTTPSSSWAASSSLSSFWSNFAAFSRMSPTRNPSP